MKTSKTKGATAVIVTYNRLQILKECIDHVLRQTLQPNQILVVDNCSTDGTRDYLRSIKSETIVPIFSNENLGFGYGLHLGVKYIIEHNESEYVWLLDDDSFPEQNVLANLVEGYDSFNDNDRVGILGSIGCEVSWSGGITVVHKPHAGTMIPVDFVLVDNALVKLSVFKDVGNINPDFFVMCEDYELCKRLAYNKYKIMLHQEVRVNRLHLGGGKKYSSNTLWRGYYHARNHLLILKNYFSIGELFQYIIRQSKYLIMALFFAPDRWTRSSFRIRGILDGISGVKGKTLDPKSLKFTKQ